MLSQKQILTLFMIRNQQGNTLSNLAVPKETLMFEIGGYSADKLLESVIDSNYDEMTKILRAHRMLMFTTGTAIDIDGQLIKTTPFEYALKMLDTYAWKLCYAIALEDQVNKKIYLSYFQKYTNQFTDCVNLTVLYNAYNVYLEAFRLHKTGFITLEKLKEIWLNVGIAQRYHVPRHMLREMSALNPNLDMIKKDLLLLTADRKKDLSLDYLKQISKQFNDCPILVNKQHTFAFYRVNVLNELHCFETKKLPFMHIAFPEEPNIPMLKKPTVENCQEYFDYYGPWQNLYTVDLDNYIPLKYPSVGMISKIDGSDEFEMIELEFKISDLGEKYTLARGAARDWIGVAFPLGVHNMLNHRATHDLKTFGNLVKLRLEERQTFFEEILEAKQGNDISDKSTYLKKMTIK